jgi:hypothetical protein
MEAGTREAECHGIVGLVCIRVVKLEGCGLYMPRIKTGTNSIIIMCSEVKASVSHLLRRSFRQFRHSTAVFGIADAGTRPPSPGCSRCWKFYQNHQPDYRELGASYPKTTGTVFVDPVSVTRKQIGLPLLLFAAAGRWAVVGYCMKHPMMIAVTCTR